MELESSNICVIMPSRRVPDPAAFSAAGLAASQAGASFAYPAGEPRDMHRNKCVRGFLDNPARFSHLLFVDDDTPIPPDAVGMLLAARRPIICGIQPLYLNRELVANVAETRTAEGLFHWADWLNWTPPAEPFPVLACGFGCVLIERKVLEAIEFPWFIEECGDAYGNGHTTEDIYFCRKVQRAGYMVYAHPGVICGHRKTVDLAEWIPRHRVRPAQTKE